MYISSTDINHLPLVVVRKWSEPRRSRSLLELKFVVQMFFYFLKSSVLCRSFFAFLNSHLVQIFPFSFLDSQFSAYVRYSLLLVGTDWLNVINRLDGPLWWTLWHQSNALPPLKEEDFVGLYKIAQTMRVVTVHLMYRPFVL